jgi:hypothetical protein
MVNDGMDENIIPVQTPSIRQSEQTLEWIQTEWIHRGTKFSSSRFPLTPFEILQILFWVLIKNFQANETILLAKSDLVQFCRIFACLPASNGKYFHAKLK